MTHKILTWYEDHQREFPWRATTFRKVNPYYVWLSEIMLQQTTTQTVIPYFQNFIRLWPTLKDLSLASQDDVLHAWQGLGYYSRARNLHKCAIYLQENEQGKFPTTEPELLKLPGVGPYTAAAIAAIAFKTPTLPIDGNIKRILSRYHAQEFFPGKGLTEKFISVEQPGAVAQALMDIGATLCRPQNPDCLRCPLQSTCQAHIKGQEHDFPVRKQRKSPPERYGYIYWVENPQNEVLLVKRPETGLLGGMMGFPGTPWSDTPWQDTFPKVPFVYKQAQKIKGDVRHTFSHFHINLRVIHYTGVTHIEREDSWLWGADLSKYAFPTVMKKIIRLVRDYDP